MRRWRHFAKKLDRGFMSLQGRGFVTKIKIFGTRGNACYIKWKRGFCHHTRETLRRRNAFYITGYGTPECFARVRPCLESPAFAARLAIIHLTEQP